MDIVAQIPTAAETLPILANEADTLPRLVDRAAAALAGARDAAEVLAAKEVAATTYEVAARIARLKRAGETIVEQARLAMAASVELEAMAWIRLATEYTDGQKRGEIRSHGRGNGRSASALSAADLGLGAAELARGRLFRDAEAREPGCIHRVLHQALSEGREPNKVLLRTALPSIAGQRKSAPRDKPKGAMKHVVTCRTAVRKVIQSALKKLPSESDQIILFNEIAAEIGRLRSPNRRANGNKYK